MLQWLEEGPKVSIRFSYHVDDDFLLFVPLFRDLTLFIVAFEQMPEDYLQYTDYIADISGSTHPGWTPAHAYGSFAAMMLGLFGLYHYYQSQPEKAAERPYIRKQFPYNTLYLERGGDPEKLHLLPPINEEVYDPYPYYGENSIDYKSKHGIAQSKHL